MKIAIDSGVAVSDFKTGKGWYAWNLIYNLAKIDRENFYILYDITSRRIKAYQKCYSYLPCQRNFRVKILPFHSSIGRKLIPVEFLTGDIDILHILEEDISPVLKAKKIVTVHDIITFFEIVIENIGWKIDNLKGMRKRATRIKKTILKADKIIAVSENTKRDIIKYFSIDPSKITVIYEGKDEIFRPMPDTERIEEIKKRYNITKKFILATGTSSPRKNLGRLLSCFEKVKRKNKCQLVIFGNIKQRNEWFEIFKRLPVDIREDIIFTGYVPSEELPYLYNGAEFFIYPSLYEGFGLPPLEAMACGCPVITSNTSSLPEVVGEAGVLIDPYNVDEMAEKMEQLLLDESLRKKLKIKGLERTKMFTWENTARETLKVYKEVYSGK